MRWIDPDMFHAEVNEEELHDMLATRKFVYLGDDREDFDGDQIQRITLVPTDPSDVSVDRDTAHITIGQMEGRVNALLSLMNDTDAAFHDDFEYACTNSH